MDWVNVIKIVLIIGACVAGIFAVAFYIEYFFGSSERSARNRSNEKTKTKNKELENSKDLQSSSEKKIEKVFSSKEVSTAETRESKVESNDLEAMLAKLEAKANEPEPVKTESKVAFEEVKDTKKINDIEEVEVTKDTKVEVRKVDSLDNANKKVENIDKATVAVSAPVSKDDDVEDDSIEAIRRRALARVEERRREAARIEAQKRGEGVKSDEVSNLSELKRIQEQRKLEETRKAEEAKKLEDEKKAEETRKVEEARKLEVEKKVEEERQSILQKKLDEQKRIEEQERKAILERQAETEKRLTELQKKQQIEEEQRLRIAKLQEKQMETTDTQSKKIEEIKKSSEVQSAKQSEEIQRIQDIQRIQEIKRFEEVSTKKVAFVKNSNDDDDDEEIIDDDSTSSGTKTSVIKVVASNPDGLAIDYETRLLTIQENYAKIERDYSKTHNAVLKYERTVRRKTRNEKLLNRKAAELTNLNLVLYNVKDIKSIDPEKKLKQEELTKHIAELKESIKTADIFLEENASKYDNNKKFDGFLDKEKQRYEVEIKELEQLIKDGKKKK